MEIDVRCLYLCSGDCRRLDGIPNSRQLPSREYRTQKCCADLRQALQPAAVGKLLTGLLVLFGKVFECLASSAFIRKTCSLPPAHCREE